MDDHLKMCGEIYDCFSEDCSRPTSFLTGLI
jgi:hypothetical protein